MEGSHLPLLMRLCALHVCRWREILPLYHSEEEQGNALVISLHWSRLLWLLRCF